jgi:hypothetical protein
MVFELGVAQRAPLLLALIHLTRLDCSLPLGIVMSLELGPWLVPADFLETVLDVAQQAPPFVSWDLKVALDLPRHLFRF